MNHPKHGADAALPVQAPLFASTWMALFHLIRASLMNQPGGAHPPKAGEHTRAPH